MQSASTRQLALLTASSAALLLGWDFSRLDLPLAHWFGSADGFALREHWLLANLLHDGGRRLAWALTLGLSLAVWWPVGALRRLSFNQRLQLAVTTLATALAVSTLKSFSGTSCPWDLAEFGGVARYASHWRYWLQPDGGSGRCFPAGHRRRLVRVPAGGAGAGAALAAGALAAGLLLGLGQQGAARTS
jgi:membrane-associated PAP2 superfamily phosphatase